MYLTAGVALHSIVMKQSRALLFSIRKESQRALRSDERRLQAVTQVARRVYRLGGRHWPSNPAIENTDAEFDAI